MLLWATPVVFIFEVTAVSLLLLIRGAVAEDAILQLVAEADNSFMILLLLLSVLLTGTQGVNGQLQQDSDILRLGHDMVDMTTFAATMTKSGYDRQETLPVCFLAWSEGRTISVLLLAVVLIFLSEGCIFIVVDSWSDG